MNPYHLLWAWASKNVMQSKHCEWTIKMWGVPLISLMRRRQRKCKNGWKIFREETRFGGLHLIFIYWLLFSVVSLWGFLNSFLPQRTKAVWDDTPKEGCWSAEIEWTGLYWVSNSTSLRFKVKFLASSIKNLSAAIRLWHLSLHTHFQRWHYDCVFSCQWLLLMICDYKIAYVIIN